MKVTWWMIDKFFATALVLMINVCLILIAIGTLIFMLVETQIMKLYGDRHGYGTFVSDVIIITACLFLVAVAAFGIFGLKKESVKILNMYFGFLTILLVGQVFITVHASIQRYDLQDKVSKWLIKDFFHNATGYSLEQQRRLWDNLQSTYRCCAVSGPGDYIAMEQPVSQACCLRAYYEKNANARRQFYQTCMKSHGITNMGCENVILSMLTYDGEWLISAAVMSFGFEGLAMLLVAYVTQKPQRYVITTMNKLPL